MNILLICDSYYPDRISSAIQMQDLANELCACGHEITVLVPDYKVCGFISIASIGKVNVIKVKALKNRDVGKIRRGFAELLMPIILLSAVFLYKNKFNKFHGIVWYSPTIFFGILVGYLTKINNVKNYLILRDIFPQWAWDSGVIKNKYIMYFFTLFEFIQYKFANTIGVQSPANLVYFKNYKYKLKAKIEVLNNWLSIFNKITISNSDKFNFLENKVVIVYAGNMGEAQDMPIIIELALKLSSREDVLMLMVGRGSEVSNMKDAIIVNRLRNLFILDEIAFSEMPELLSKCDIGLLTLNKKHSTHNVPGKLLAYLRAGIPVLASVNAGNDVIDIIENNAVGRVSAKDGLDDFLDKAIELINDAELRMEMGKNSLILADSMFSTSVIAKQIVSNLTSTK